VPHVWGLGTVTGSFNRFDCFLTETDGERRIELTIDTNSLDTRNRRRDTHLRSADLFDTANHPAVHFRSTSVSGAGAGRLRVDGELEAAGERVPLTFSPLVEETEDRLELDADTTVDQRQLGMTWSPFGIARTPTKSRCTLFAPPSSS
jgi:polyisoprenoid-binding protein YceI